MDDVERELHLAIERALAAGDNDAAYEHATTLNQYREYYMVERIREDGRRAEDRRRG